MSAPPCQVCISAVHSLDIPREAVQPLELPLMRNHTNLAGTYQCTDCRLAELVPLQWKHARSLVATWRLKAQGVPDPVSVHGFGPERLAPNRFETLADLHSWLDEQLPGEWA